MSPPVRGLIPVTNHLVVREFNQCPESRTTRSEIPTTDGDQLFTQQQAWMSTATLALGTIQIGHLTPRDCSVLVFGYYNSNFQQWDYTKS